MLPRCWRNAFLVQRRRSCTGIAGWRLGLVETRLARSLSISTEPQSAASLPHTDSEHGQSELLPNVRTRSRPFAPEPRLERPTSAALRLRVATPRPGVAHSGTTTTQYAGTS